MNKRLIFEYLPNNIFSTINDTFYIPLLTKLIILSLFFIISLNVYAQKPVIIGFGWDSPDVEQLSKKIDSMQNTPFDGICFSIQRSIMEAFDTVALKETYFKYDKLRSLKWGRYTNNFIILRGYSITGGNWFDDKAWLSITNNMMGLSKAMLIGKLKGILFDPEYYNQNQFYNPWTYNKTQYPNLSFEEVQNRVRERGTQFISALQKYTSDFAFLSIWITSLIVLDKKLGPMEGTRHALLLPFIEGILLGKNKKVKIIDGNEYAYWNIRPSQFLESADYLKKNTIELMRSAKAKHLATGIEISQPIFYDGLLVTDPSFEKGVVDTAKWKWLEENLKYAIATSTSNIVWFYYERIKWWENKVNDTLINILQNCKQGFIPGLENKYISPNKLLQPKCYNVNKSKGYYYPLNHTTPMKTGGIAFTYTWDLKNKKLKLKYVNKIPTSVTIFLNNTMLTSGNPKSFEDTIKLKNFTMGRLAILAKYNNEFEACGIQDIK